MLFASNCIKFNTYQLESNPILDVFASQGPNTIRKVLWFIHITCLVFDLQRLVSNFRTSTSNF